MFAPAFWLPCWSAGCGMTLVWTPSVLGHCMWTTCAFVDGLLLRLKPIAEHWRWTKCVADIRRSERSMVNLFANPTWITYSVCHGLSRFVQTSSTLWLCLFVWFELESSFPCLSTYSLFTLCPHDDTINPNCGGWWADGLWVAVCSWDVETTKSTWSWREETFDPVDSWFPTTSTTSTIIIIIIIISLCGENEFVPSLCTACWHCSCRKGCWFTVFRQQT